MDQKTITEAIKKKAILLGFEGCGISRAELLLGHQSFLQNWLDKGLHAGMGYMARNFTLRINPTKLMPGAKSVISVLLNYYPEKTQKDKEAPIVAKYAYGKDYHQLIKRKLNSLLDFIKEELIPCEGRVFTDSAPLLERALASKAGLGWIGKNTLLISPTIGSFTFLGEILVDIELDFDSPIEDRCGTCTKCLHACPTNALVTPYKLDSNRCISYQTIENKGEIPSKLKGKFMGRVFGCDICQDVCPWNSKAKPTTEKDLVASSGLLDLTPDDWVKMDQDLYQKVFKDSAVKRAKFNGLRRNIDFIQEEDLNV